MVASRRLQNFTEKTTELLASSNLWFKNIDTRLETFCSSQIDRRTLYQDKMINIEDRLIYLQQRLGAGTMLMGQGRSVQDVVATKAAERPRAYRKLYLDLGLCGQVASSRSITAGKRSNEPKQYNHHYTFTFTPPQWLSNLVLRWDLRIKSVLNRPPSIRVSLSPILYNPNQDLKAAITTFDLPGLQRLFREGLAQPTDYIIQRKPISLLEVCLPIQ